MSGLFGKLFGGARALSQARAAELRGDLAQATALFAQAGRLDEAARVLLVRGDVEPDPSRRLRHYAQAVVTAPIASGVRVTARRKRALFVLGTATNVPLTPRLQRDLVEAARELEALGENDSAAEAYARAGEIEGQTRALAQAGDLEHLGEVLGEELRREREALGVRMASGEVVALAATGYRREAARMARASADETLRERGAALEARRVAGPIVSAILRGRPLAIALGDEVVIGRMADEAAVGTRAGTILVASVAVSRKHLSVMRRGTDVIVRDLGGRNGTRLRGLALRGDATVGDGIELTLGGEVRLVVRPSEELEGSVVLEVAGARYVAPLGPGRVGVGRWRLERADDGWVELATEDTPAAFAGSLRLSQRIALLHGDALACERGGGVLLELV